MEPIKSKKEMVAFFGGLSSYLSQNELYAYIKDFDPDAIIEMKMDFDTGRNKGFAFIIFQSQDAFDKVVKTKHFVGGRQVDCQIGHRGLDKEKDIIKSIQQKIFVKKVDESIDSESLTKYFEQFGKVNQCYIIYDPETKKSKNIGYVEFEDSLSIDKVLSQKHFINKEEIICDKYIPRALMGPPNFRTKNLRKNLNKVNRKSYEYELKDDEFGDQEKINDNSEDDTEISKGNSLPFQSSVKQVLNRQQHFQKQHQNREPMYGQQSQYAPKQGKDDYFEWKNSNFYNNCDN